MNLTTNKLKNVYWSLLRHNENCSYYFENSCQCEYWNQVRPNAKRYGLKEIEDCRQAIIGNATETD